MRDSLLVNIGYWVMAFIVNIVICAFSMDERERERGGGIVCCNISVYFYDADPQN